MNETILKGVFVLSLLLMIVPPIIAGAVWVVDAVYTLSQTDPRAAVMFGTIFLGFAMFVGSVILVVFLPTPKDK